MISGIDPQGNNETREQNIEPAGEVQPEVQDSIQVNTEKPVDVSREIEKTRPKWDTISSDWSNRVIKECRSSIKAFIIRLMKGEMTDIEDELWRSPRSVLEQTLDMLIEQWHRYQQNSIDTLPSIREQPWPACQLSRLS